MEAVVYHANHLKGVKSAISELESKDSPAISTAKTLMESESIVPNVAYNSAHYNSMPKSIETLKTKGLPLVESLALVKALLSEFEKSQGESSKIVLKKFQNVLSTNPGYKQMLSISESSLVNQSRYFWISDYSQGTLRS